MLSNQSSKPKTYCRFVSAKIEIISKEDLICCKGHKTKCNKMEDDRKRLYTLIFK